MINKILFSNFMAIIIMFLFGSTLKAPLGDIEATLNRAIICENDCFDWAPVITSGIPPYTYQWSTGETDSLITLCPESSAIYMLTITDAEGDSLVLNESVLIGPNSQKPIPSVTTPMCTGETAFFYHPNFGYAPTYHWLGPNGFESNERNPMIENLTLDHSGEYTLYLKYLGKCLSDTISVFLEVQDKSSETSCDQLERCNFACDVLEFFRLGGLTTSDISTGIQPEFFCSENNVDIGNIEWFGFVAQGGEHTISMRANYCTDSSDGLRYAIYDNCDFSNIIKCTDTCSFEEFEIPSSMLIPGQTYYVCVEGCGLNTCKYGVSVQGTTRSIYCNDYVPMSNTTDWRTNSHAWNFNTNFWYNYLNDTIINSLVYRIIGVNGNNDYRRLLMREDIDERKVYFYNENAGIEKLYYNFSLEIGDNYQDPNYNSLWEVVDIKIIPSDIGPLKEWHFSHEFGHRFSYREAIGGNYLAIPADVLISDPVYYTSVAFADCQKIIGTPVKLINTYRSQLDTTFIEICEGESYQGIQDSMIISDTLSQNGGCAIVSTLNLLTIPVGKSELSMVLCEGEEYEGYRENGVYTDTLTTSAGCDSIRTLTLEFLEHSSSSLNMKICDGEEYQGYDTQGEYMIVLSSANGCDSIVFLQLDVAATFVDSLFISICEGQEYEGYSSTGIYQDTFIADNGCDSLRILTLEVLPSTDPDCMETSSSEIHNQNKLLIYPNPGNGIIKLIDTSHLVNRIKIYNISGELVFKKDAVNISFIDTSSFEPGIYIIVLSTETKNFVQQLVVTSN